MFKENESFFEELCFFFLFFVIDCVVLCMKAAEMEHSPFISDTLVSILIPTQKTNSPFLPDRFCFEQNQNNKAKKEKKRKNYNRKHTILTFVHKAEIDLLLEPDSVQFQTQ